MSTNHNIMDYILCIFIKSSPNHEFKKRIHPFSITIPRLKSREGTSRKNIDIHFVLF